MATLTTAVATSPPSGGAPPREARLIFIRGAVQGVGFRPFVARLAAELGVDGWVRNDRAGVTILACGGLETLAVFARDLRARCPPAAAILGFREQSLGDDFCDDALEETGFQIVASEGGSGPSSAVITPDLATCADCLRELFDPNDRRHLYPFTNCTQCGPRFSILRRLPYDRPRTTMAAFMMCPACQAEYVSPLSRRHHAQPNACPDCGPRLTLLDAAGTAVTHTRAALREAADRLRAGEFVAVKGIGGFHLVADARADPVVRSLRERKHREEKPFAVMFPDVGGIMEICELSTPERVLLEGVAAPIVLLRKRPAGGGSVLAPALAPGNPRLGCFLPYSPLHHLLLRKCGFPLVATSGNRTDEPICVDNDEAVSRLRGIADAFLVHDRPIARPVDDSVVRVAAGRTLFLRRSRGYAPLPIAVPALAEAPDAVATGGHLKNTVALKRGADLFLSQHLGDLDTVPAREAQREALEALLGLYDAPPAVIACDLHPDYASTRLAEAFAREQVPPAEVVRVQHHHAHLATCLADNGTPPGERVLGAIWDGTGFGPDRTVWGGEFLLGNARDFERVASLRPFRLPAGERATREPRLAALGLLHDWLGPESWEHPAAVTLLRSPEEKRVLRQILARGLNCPLTTSVGRLFDAVSALLGLPPNPARLTYEGQAAVALEAAASEAVAHDAGRLWETEPLPWRWVEPDAQGSCGHFDLAPALTVLLGADREEAPRLAARFHRLLVDVMVSAAQRFAQRRLALSGGCFQNALLLEGAVLALQRAGVEPMFHRALPPNDGALAAGQLVVSAARALPVSRR